MNKNAGDIWNDLYRKTEEHLEDLSLSSFADENDLESRKIEILSNILSLQSQERQERIAAEKEQAEKWKSDHRLAIIAIIIGLLTLAATILGIAA